MAIFSVASFRGAPFYVRNVRDRGMGRNIKVHEYPNQSAPYIEDLGFKTQYFEFEGFVSTDSDTYVSRDLLEAALHISGLGELLHPTRGMFRAACTEQEIGEEINEKGLVQVRLQFVAATIKPQVPLTPLGLIDTQGDLIEDALSGLDDISTGLGTLGSTLMSSAVAGATTAITSVGIGGIDSIFSNSTCGRYSQSTTNSTQTIIANPTGSSDSDKFNNARTQAVNSTTNAKASLNKSVQNLGSS